MMRSRVLVLALVLCAVCAMAEDTKAGLKAVTDGTTKFATNFFKAVSNESKGKNLICSSLSAHVVLSMVAYGAGGNTATQMRNTLNLPNQDQLGRQGFQDLMSEMNNVENVTLEMANKVYVANKFEVKPEYKQLTSGPFRSEAATLDIDHPVDAAKDVNSWVDEKTHHKIKDILSSDDITKDTRMVLLNAIYFKGKWSHAFKKEFTKDLPFYYKENNNKMEKKVPTMYSYNNYFYGELPDLKARFIELPYENKNLKMVIIVPDEIDGLSNIVANIESFNSSRLRESGAYRDVNLYLPKFKIESTIQLNDVLEKLGMSEMFTNNANFSGISNERVKVDKVVQKAFIEVNEEGSEAAAVTGVIAVLKSIRIPEKKYELRVDRPFYYAIIDESNNVNLFEGNFKQL